MEYRNLLNFVLSLLLIFSLFVYVPFLKKYVTVLAVTIFGIKSAEWLMESTRKYFFYKIVSPKHKVVLITGCDTGFGNALARRLDKLGYSVLATCLFPDGEGARKLSEDCSGKLTVLPMDITDEQSIQKVKLFVEKNLGQNALWAVVNNAGIAQCGQIEWTSVEEFEHTCNVNTFGALRVTKAFLPFIKQSKGRIVNVTSSAGRFIIPGTVGYCLSKSGAVALSNGLQIELLTWGVKCISIEPFMYTTSLVNKQALFRMAKKSWNSAPNDVKEEFGDDYLKAFNAATDTLISLLGNSNISEVISCLEDAITAEDPLSVYIPANVLHRIIAVLFFKVLPLEMTNYIYSWLFNFHGTPQALKTKTK